LDQQRKHGYAIYSPPSTNLVSSLPYNTNLLYFLAQSPEDKPEAIYILINDFQCFMPERGQQLRQHRIDNCGHSAWIECSPFQQHLTWKGHLHHSNSYQDNQSSFSSRIHYFCVLIICTVPLKYAVYSVHSCWSQPFWS
jgi:hypothetical protein